MTEILSQYAIGDWIVHHAYGIGQIEKIEEKPINGDVKPCFQVKANNGAQWWFPNDGEDNPRIRPVASLKMLQRAQKELQEPGEILDPDKNFWKGRINDVVSSGDFTDTYEIVRDLTVLKTQRKLNQMEVKAYNLCKDRLLNEWSATVNIEIDQLRPMLRGYLKTCADHAAA